MKRYSAGKNTDMRKGTETEAARPFGPLTDKETEDIRQAYREGCKGEIIIGMRGDKRVITMLVPAQLGSDTQDSMMAQCKKQLERMVCDRSVCIRWNQANNK